jgi:hypothetical protein
MCRNAGTISYFHLLEKKDSMAHVLLLFPLEKEFIHVRMFSLT